MNITHETNQLDESGTDKSIWRSYRDVAEYLETLKGTDQDQKYRKFIEFRKKAWYQRLWDWIRKCLRA